MLAFYQALDLFCLSSRQEGMPLSLLEAQACDVPCVASHVGGTQEAVCPKTGALVPAEDATRLAAALAAMLLNPPQVHHDNLFWNRQMCDAWLLPMTAYSPPRRYMFDVILAGSVLLSVFLIAYHHVIFPWWLSRYRRNHPQRPSTTPNRHFRRVQKTVTFPLSPS
ncbi:glycosyltransferase [Pseudobowmanella zhangzhouensis]|uniref:glycosyltransferase n=1 Tax=Pseudobowmanella zhangzhouensis TaxID=1537679 RepID=UPI00361B475B